MEYCMEYIGTGYSVPRLPIRVALKLEFLLRSILLRLAKRRLPDPNICHFGVVFWRCALDMGYTLDGVS